MALLARVTNTGLALAVLLTTSVQVHNRAKWREEHPIISAEVGTSALLGNTLRLPHDRTAPKATLVLVLSTHCPFCASSMPFYRRVVASAAKTEDLRVVAVMQQDLKESAGYLRQHGIDPSTIGIHENRQLHLTVAATPTVLLLDQTDRIVGMWVGSLSALDQEAIVRRIGQVCKTRL